MIDIKDDDDVHAMIKALAVNKNSIYLYTCKPCVDKVIAVVSNPGFVTLSVIFSWHKIYAFRYPVN